MTNLTKVDHGYLKEWAEMSYETGHGLPEDFKDFKKTCEESGYSATEKDYQRFWNFYHDYQERKAYGDEEEEE